MMVIAGIDEAGRGALAGPVVAGAVIFKSVVSPNTCEVFKWIKDSKKLTGLQREVVYEWIIKNVDYGVSLIGADIIDEIGIRRANERAMNEAVSQLRIKPDKLLVDGRDKFQFEFESEDIIKGDEKILEISAASIIAKVTRDRYMTNVACEYPGFGFESHKGYGAKDHYKMLDNGEFCEEHRKTYDPLKTWLNQGRLF